MKRVLSEGYLLSFCFFVLGSPRPAFSQISLFKITGAPLILTGGMRTPGVLLELFRSRSRGERADSKPV
jgi:hypothetical protein